MSSCDKSHADHDRTKITFPTVSICALALWLAVEPDGATLLTLLAALYDLLRTLPEGLRAGLHLDGALRAVGSVLPLSSQGLGWICPAALGLVIGLIAHFAGRRKAE